MSHNQATEQEQQKQQEQHNESAARIPDPEMVLKAKRRQFSAEYKRHILQEAEACSEPGQIGALLRGESSYLLSLPRRLINAQKGDRQWLRKNAQVVEEKRSWNAKLVEEAATSSEDLPVNGRTALSAIKVGATAQSARVQAT